MPGRTCSGRRTPWSVRRPAPAAVGHGAASAAIIAVDGQACDREDLIGWSAISKLGRLPATVMPMTTTPDGRPVGVQIIGPHLEDHMVIALARMLSS